MPKGVVTLLLLLVLSEALAVSRRPKLRPKPRSLSGYRRTSPVHRTGSDGQPLFWYCRRGSRLAVCYRRGHHAKTASAPGALLARGQNSAGREILQGDCTPSSCRNGECVGNECKCRSGWTGKGCNKDMDECQTDDHLCQHRCANTAGSYTCSCNTGYRLHADGRTCRMDYFGRNVRPRKQSKTIPKADLSGNGIDLNKGRSQSRYYAELLRKLALPKLRTFSTNPKSSCRFARCQYRCVFNNNENPECVCPQGMKLATNKRSCVDRNECLDSSKSVCPHDQECSNTYGGFSCKCPVGQAFTYTLHGKICNDVNECFTGDHKCGRHARCTNTPGSYTCECIPGYHGDGVVCRVNPIFDAVLSPRRLTSLGLLPRAKHRHGYSRPGVLKTSPRWSDLN